MSPFELRREPIHEVCLLIERLNDHTRRNPKRKKGNNTKIRRKARDDWF